MLLSEFLNYGEKLLQTLYPVQEARSIMFILCEGRIGTKNYTHIIDPGFEVPRNMLHSLKSDVDRLSKGEPIQYVLGKTEFYDLTFNVAPGVLIPRPETELLVQQAVKLGGMIYRERLPWGKGATPVRILDLCTGSGCIAWSVTLNVPTASTVAVDISDDALAIAKSQPFKELLKEKGAKAPDFIKADVLAEDSIDGFSECDLILSNPPYIKDSEKSQMRTNVLDYEPSLALFVADDDPLLFYRTIAKWSSKLMSKEGKGLTEINETLGEETARVFRDEGFKAEVVKDYFNKDRFVLYYR